MNKNLTKVLSFIFALTMTCAYTAAKDIDAKEVQTQSITLPAFTVSADKDVKVEEKAMQPIADEKKEEVKKAVDEAEIKLNDAKEATEKAIEKTTETLKQATQETKEAVEGTVETTQTTIFNALQNTKLEPKTIVPQDEVQNAPEVSNTPADTEANALEHKEKEVSETKSDSAVNTDNTTEAINKAAEEITRTEEATKEEVQQKTKKIRKFDAAAIFNNLRPEVRGNTKPAANVENTKKEVAPAVETKAEETIQTEEATVESTTEETPEAAEKE